MDRLELLERSVERVVLEEHTHLARHAAPVVQVLDADRDGDLVGQFGGDVGAVADLQAERVLTGRKAQHRVGLTLAEVAVVAVFRNGRPRFETAVVHRHVEVAGIRMDLAGGLDGHACGLHLDGDRARDVITVGGCGELGTRTRCVTRGGATIAAAGRGGGEKSDEHGGRTDSGARRSNGIAEHGHDLSSPVNPALVRRWPAPVLPGARRDS